MRYMMLIYSQEAEGVLTPEDKREIMTAHYRVIEEATRKGVLQGVEPLSPTTTATTVRMQDDNAMITDGPFAETKEQLAGYYIIDCRDLDEAIEWASKIPSSCKGRGGCIEIRPLPGLPALPDDELLAARSAGPNG